MNYTEAIVEALERLGGHAYLRDIYEEFQNVYSGELSKTWQNSLRAAIERNSADSNAFDGKESIFYSVDGLGNGHWGLVNYQNNIQELSQDDDAFSEGKKLLKKHLQIERNVSLISAAKKRFLASHGHLYCEICGFDFQSIYGKLGEGFIEAHHMKPVSEMKEGDKTRIEDIIMVCSNCHSMIHRKKPWLKADELKSLLDNSTH